MKIVFLLERPSQFDAPLFRLAAADPEHRFEAWFTSATPGGMADDPELGRAVDWGQDLLAGYRWATMPGQGRREWLRRQLAGERPDLLIVNGYTRAEYLAAARAGRAVGVTTALRIDSVRFPGSPRPGLARRLLVARALHLVFDRYLTTGRLGESYLLACGVVPANIGRFTYAVDHAAFAAASALSAEERARERVRLGLPAAGKVVLSLTKFSEREAPWDLLAARQHLRGAGFCWLLAGDGPLRDRLMAEAVALSLDPIVFPGYVPYQELPRLYAVADLFVHPAREERWGVSVAEALACGLPVVASDRVGAAYDLVEPGVNGGRYPAGVGEALARAIGDSLRPNCEAAAPLSRDRLQEFGLQATWSELVRASKACRAE